MDIHINVKDILCNGREMPICSVWQTYHNTDRFDWCHCSMACRLDAVICGWTMTRRAAQVTCDVCNSRIACQPPMVALRNVYCVKLVVKDSRHLISEVSGYWWSGSYTDARVKWVQEYTILWWAGERDSIVHGPDQNLVSPRWTKPNGFFLIGVCP